MVKKKEIFHSDYSLAVRIRLRNGSWGAWSDRGYGQWIGLEHVQAQIMMLRKSYSRDMQIEFKKDSQLLDYSGNVTEKPIYYEKAR